jgi:hypothetical protein
VTSRSNRPAGGDQDVLVAHVRRTDEVPAVDRDHPERPAAHPCAQRAVVGVDHPHAHGSPGGRPQGGDPRAAAAGPPAAVGVHRGDEVLHVVLPTGGEDDEGAEQAAPHLGVRHLVGVVPERAGVLGEEAVDVVLAGAHRVLGDPGDAVLGVRHVDPVPVQGHPVGDVDVGQRDLHEVALVHLERRPGGGAVEGVARDAFTAGQLERLLARRKLDGDVRLARHRAGQVGDAPSAAVLVSGAAPVLGVPHLHDRIGRGHQTREPVPAETTQEDEGDDGRDQHPPASADGLRQGAWSPSASTGRWPAAARRPPRPASRGGRRRPRG